MALKNKKWFRYLIATTSLVMVMTFGWLIFETAFHLTGDYEFCTSCHSHKPIGKSYRASLHGGANIAGWRATCSQCHIPHDNALNFLIVKGYHGVKDPFLELVKDSYDIDWHAMRAHREKYTYDSGCLECHKFLKSQSSGSGKAFLAHQSYFKEDADRQLKCVTCHEHVGHKDLGIYLQEAGWVNNKEVFDEHAQ